MTGFIITRFTHGSGGKFLSSVIQTSNAVDHWFTALQNHKHHEIFPQLIKHYFDRCFPLDHSLAIRNEPHCPYCTDLYSGSYPRGNDVTTEQFLAHAHQVNDTRFLNSWYQDRFVNLIFNKPEIPRFCDNSSVVTITIETEAEQQWVYQTLWRKHWIELEEELIYAPDNPEYCHMTTLSQVLKFNNPSRYPATEKSRLWNEFVLQNHTRHWYLDHDKFQSYDRCHGLHNVFIALRSFFDRDQFIHNIDHIVREFSLDPINLDLVDTMRSIWVSRQIAFND